MKLTDLAIEGYGVFGDLRLGQFCDGLNIIFGDTGSGKTTIRNFIRGVMYGFDSSNSHFQLTAEPSIANGSLDVRYNNLDYRLSRDVRISGELYLHPMSSTHHATQDLYGVHELTGNLSPDLFDTFFNLAFHDTKEQAFNLASCLHTRMGVPLGKSAIRDENAVVRWQQETDSLNRQLASIQERIDSLTIEKRGNHQQIDQEKKLHDQQLTAISTQIAEISARLDSINTLTIENEIANIKTDIAQILDLIADAEVHYVPTIPATETAEIVSTYATLYQRLDEIDNQIRRWRRVQSDIQNQRVRLRDEMLVWNELTLDSDEHPYHNARGILVALESKVDHAEHQVKNWNKSSPVTNESSMRHLADLCKQMREDIYGLCHELGHQYKHIRHKAAAAELKQLRRCYNEMGENTERLVKRRESVVDEIRRVDPAGAEAIKRSDHQFCHCAQHEGHLEARRRYIGELTETVPAPLPQQSFNMLRPNLDAHRARLAELERKLADRQNKFASLRKERQEFRVRHAELIGQRDRLLTQINRQDLLAKIENIDVELRRLTDQHNNLSHQLDSLKLVESTPNPILDRAAGYLSRMSLGDLSLVWLGERVGEIVVLDRAHNTLPFHALSRGQKDQVSLSLCLAVSDSLKRQGIKAPMLLDDVFANIDAQRVEATFDVLCEHGLGGSQVVVFAKRNEFERPANTADIAVFELPQTGVSPLPFTSPERQPYIPFRENNWETHLNEGSQFFQADDDGSNDYEPTQLRSYPLTKYPRTGNRSAISASTFEQTNFVSAVNPTPTSYAPETTLSESSLIGDHGIVEFELFGILNDLGIIKLSDLFEIDSSNVDFDFVRSGITGSQIDRWQSQYWILLCVPGMAVVEAQVLYACGITEPEQLDTIHSQQLLERVQRFLSSPDGNRFSNASCSNHRIDSWYRALDSTRSRWQKQGGYSRISLQRNRSTGPRLSRVDAAEGRYESPQAVERTPRQSTIRDPRVPVRTTTSRNQSSAPTTPMVQSFTERHRSARPVTARESTADLEEHSQKKAASSRAGGKLKFFLDLNDHVEAAPSIGPRTSERFEKVGVVSVGDLLKQTAESMAAKINYKRISADIIRNWQHQTRLVCRVPNLRGHDAQLLVACGITEPEDLAIMQPKKLFDIIGPFSETKEGLKIIRNGKKPDLDEITDWIDWAGHTRSLQAA